MDVQAVCMYVCFRVLGLKTEKGEGEGAGSRVWGFGQSPVGGDLFVGGHAALEVLNGAHHLVLHQNRCHWTPPASRPSRHASLGRFAPHARAGLSAILTGSKSIAMPPSSPPSSPLPLRPPPTLSPSHPAPPRRARCHRGQPEGMRSAPAGSRQCPPTARACCAPAAVRWARSWHEWHRRALRRGRGTGAPADGARVTR